MIRLGLTSLTLACLAKDGYGWSTLQGSVSRRAFVSSASVATAFVLQNNIHSECPSCCNCLSCRLRSSLIQPANAYERRDVGGNDRSAATAALNEQAYETNNRLEKSGLKMESAEEQSAALTAALSDFSYDASPNKSSKNGSTKKSAAEKSKK